MPESVNVFAGVESETNLQVRARKLVRDYYNSMVNRGEIDFPRVTLEKVYVVWFSKVLGNWKAMVGTMNPDDRYFEVTHNGETSETYVDHYEKQGQMVVGKPSIALERAERELFRSEVQKAAEHSARNMRDNYNYSNSQIAEEMGISESVVRCLLVK